MTTQGKSLEELGWRAVACKHWRWMPGMLTMCNVRVVEGDNDYLIGHRPGATSDGGGWVDRGDASGFLPDLSDPATLGCLLHLVREAWRQKTIYVEHDKHSDSPWIAVVEMIVFDGQSEAEALVVALEAAH